MKCFDAKKSNVLIILHIKESLLNYYYYNFEAQILNILKYIF